MPQKPVMPATDQTRADKSRNREKPGRNEQTQDRAEERKAAGADLNLPLQFDRLTAVGRDGESRLLPGIETTLDDEGLAGSVHFRGEPRGMCPPCVRHSCNER